jgi:methoxymalonate biosynthesis acyl carrier protein
MLHTEIASAIERFIRTTFGVKDNDPDFTRDVHIFDYGYVDSFGAVTLTEFVESTFAVKISNSDLMIHPMNTVNEIASFVEGRREGRL